MMNSSLQALISQVMTNESPGLFSVSLIIQSSSNSSYSYTPITINSLTIEQRFDNHYMDKIQVAFDISSADYANLYDQMQNLYATLTFTFLNKYGTIVPSIPPIRRQYRVNIINPRDVRRQFVDADLRTTPDTNILIGLIEQSIYPIRQIKLAGIYKSTSLQSVIYHSIQSFGISNAYVVPPDNTHTYDHVVIPAVKDFSEFYYWLQSDYGVYGCGISHYYSNGTIYVYAPFDLNPPFPYQATIYQAEEGAYAGASSFYSSSGKNLQIVINNNPNSVDSSQAGSENVGTSAMILRASQIIDGIVTVDQSGATFNKSNAISVSLKQSNLIDSQAVNNMYGKATDNVFAYMSGIIAHQANIIKVNWPMAVPFSLYPGMKIVYYSNDTNVVKTRTGILEYAVYTFTQRERVGNSISMAGSATLALRLQPQPTNA